MFTYNKKEGALDERVKSYLDKPVISTFSLRKIGKTTEYKYRRYGAMQTCYGLLQKVKRVYYPDFNPYQEGKIVYTRSKIRAGSSRKEGERVDKEVAQWVEQGGGPPNKKWHVLTKKLVETLNAGGHVPQAAQVPIVFPNWDAPLGTATCADLITKDMYGNLCLWEVKSGMPVQQKAKHIFFNHVKDPVTGKAIPCTTKDMWQFQLHFTEKGLVDGGLPIQSSRIIMVCKAKETKEQKKWGAMTEQMVKASWIKGLDYK